MESYGSPILMGTISCLADITLFVNDRVQMHRKQLDFLEQTTAKMQNTYGSPRLPYFRVEQGWNAEREELLSTSLDLHSIKHAKPIPPGAARNELLKVLYESDADWLICMDDDHALYEKFNGHELLWELTSPEFMQLAREGYMIMAFPAYWDGYMREVDAWGKAETHWLLKRTKHPGAMPFAAVPNVVKFGKKPVWFDDKTQASKEGEPPEDLKFMIDWIANGGRWVECMTMIGKSVGALDKSSIFESKTARSDRDSNYVQAWTVSYLKQRFPRNPALWNRTEFFKRKNPPVTLSIKRQHPYKPTEGENVDES